ncbi:hypothetical protein MMC18_006877 [Xylographa bjoerkii]|nr:hypothetical protein [Xylographa bjoerkii]
MNFILQLYPTVGKEVDKFWWSAGMFGNTEMTFGTIPHLLHRNRRSAFSKFFSPAYIRRLKPVLQGLVNLMYEKIDTGIKAGKKVNLVHAFSALTQDHQAIPYLIPALNCLPDWWVKLTDPAAWLLRVQNYDYAAQTQRVLTGGEGDRTSHSIIFHALRDDPNLPLEEKTWERLAAEASSSVGAGTLTSAHMLSLTAFFVLDDASILKRVLTELETALPDSSSSANLQTLEPLPYLNSVINEGLRLSYASMHRLARVHPKNALAFRDWVIPPNTPVGMTPQFHHENECIFSKPYEFNPQRWLDAAPKDHDCMFKYLSNFGKGSRQCAGMRLAIELYDTQRERDVAYVHDYFIPAPSFESRGVRVVKKSLGQDADDGVDIRHETWAEYFRWGRVHLAQKRKIKLYTPGELGLRGLNRTWKVGLTEAVLADTEGIVTKPEAND